MDSIRLVIADDHRLFRDGVKKLLEYESDIEVIGEAGDGKKLLRLYERKKPDILLF